MEKYNNLIDRIIDKTKYSSAVLDRDDLRQVGLMAAFEAQKKFDSKISQNIDGLIYVSVKRAIHNEAGRFYNIFTGDYKKTKKIIKSGLPKNSASLQCVNDMTYNDEDMEIS